MGSKHDTQTDLAAAFIELGKISEVSDLFTSEREKIARMFTLAKHIVTRLFRIRRLTFKNLS